MGGNARGTDEVVGLTPFADGFAAVAVLERSTTALGVTHVGSTSRARDVAAAPSRPLPDGGVAVAGDARRGENRDAYVARLDGDGTLAWERSFDRRTVTKRS